MFFKPIIQASFDEYIDIWSTLIFEFYQRIMSDDQIFLQLKDEEIAKFGTNLSAVLLFLAKASFKSKKNFTSEKNEKLLIEGITRSFYKKMLGLDVNDKTESDVEKSLKELAKVKAEAFSDFCKDTISKDVSRRQRDIVGLTRYILSESTDMKEEKLQNEMKALGVDLSLANDKCLNLIKDSIQDTTPFFSKPTYSVQNSKERKN